MSKVVSAGIMLFRRMPDLQILLGHMGGPFFEGKDAGAWGIPKGEVMEGEDPKSAALRECEEECGYRPDAGNLIDLGFVVMSSGKTVHAWACEVEPGFNQALKSNHFQMEWPKGSGNIQSFPEVDAWEWMPMDVGESRIIKAQREFCHRLRQRRM